jgi:tRNA modification GTPase
LLDLLHTHRDRLRQRVGREIYVVGISARSKGKSRGVDTAGIAESADPVERIGVARSRQALAAADLALLVLDITKAPGEEERAVAALTEGKPTVLVWNKVDLLATTDDRRPTTDDRRPTNDDRRPTTDRRTTTDHRPPAADHRQEVDNQVVGVGEGLVVRRSSLARQVPFDARGANLRDEPFAAKVVVSALTGQGLEALSQAVAGLLLGGAVAAEGRLVTNPRHRHALERSAGHLRDALAGHARGVPADLLAVDLTAALGALGEITGETVGEELLDTIFSRFCIGK